VSIISLFSGAGGLSLGFKAAGHAPSIGVEIDADACASYESNLGVKCLNRDIAADDITHAIRSVLGPAIQPMAIIGGPPCQGFTTAGARSATDSRNRLIFSYLHVVDHFKPRWVLFENVEGLLTTNGGESVRDFVLQLIRLGYWVSLRKINFAAYGVPQGRKRVIIIANRIGIAYRFSEELFAFEGKKHRRSGDSTGPTLQEALAGLPLVSDDLASVAHYSTNEPASGFDAMMRDGNTEQSVRQHYSVKFSASDRSRLAMLKPGQSLRDLPESVWPESYRSRAFRRVLDGMPTDRRGGAPAGLRRLDPTHASLTITSLAPREFIHPAFDRGLSLRECARLQSFPDRFTFVGNAASIARQIGNAFPPIAASVFASSIAVQDDTAANHNGAPREPALVEFHLTDSTGYSPALRRTEQMLLELMGRHEPSPIFLIDPIQEDPLAKLNADQKSLITVARRSLLIRISDRELIRLISVLFHDLGRTDLILEWAKLPPDYRGYYHLPLSWFTSDDQRPNDKLPDVFLSGVEQIEMFETIFECLCEIHKRRRKYDAILQAQPQPTMDQVARRGLLEYGIVKSPALTSWLVWRKWIYDVDNRSAQETGYLFEPILARALGGKPYTQTKSPVKRLDRKGARQVDCLIDAPGERRAYEFKVRLTIASSGQGRFREERAFPKEARAADFTPVLIVLDPTSNAKLDELVKDFKDSDGETYVGEAAWDHIRERAGETMARFVTKYVREPIESIVGDAKLNVQGDHLYIEDLEMHWNVDGKKIVVQVGEQSWVIDRVAEDSETGEQLADGPDPVADEALPGLEL
jgi:DNA (cytosine-5)-methyltransferase 1